MPEVTPSFYDVRWEEWNDMIRFSPAPRIRREHLLRWAKKLSCSSVLDVGCGNGEFLVEAARSLPGVTLAGADISAAIIEANRIKLPGMSFHTINLDKETLPEQYDLVVCMEVVEHCENYREAIGRLADMTGRYLMISVPCGPLFEIDRRVGHTRHFTAHEIVASLQDAGLRVEKIQCWGFPFFNIYKRLINIWPDRVCELFLSAKKYGTRQKLIASLVYGAFRLCVPWGGYQLFVHASRGD